MDEYKRALEADVREAERYYLAGFERKSQQQAFLEDIVGKLKISPVDVLDLCCGGGASSYFLSQRLLNSVFTLVDYNEDAVRIARSRLDSRRMRFIRSDYHDLDEAKQYDLVLCLQALSFVEDPRSLLEKAIDLANPGGYVIFSSLFNLDYDVDIYSRVIDHTRESHGLGLSYNYNTFSVPTIRAWMGARVKKSDFERFEIAIDLAPEGRGLGSHTVNLHGGRRLTLSGGMVMNWAFLLVQK